MLSCDLEAAENYELHVETPNGKPVQKNKVIYLSVIAVSLLIDSVDIRKIAHFAPAFISGT